MAYSRNVVSGFTLIEVGFVLAITGLMLVGIMASVTIRVSTQRYNDAVQDAVEHIRRAYSEVINVENSRSDVAFNQIYCTAPSQVKKLTENATAEVINTSASTHAGRSTCAIYGKLITFGEQNSTIVHTYTVIGNLHSSDLEDDPETHTVLGALRYVYADVIAYDREGAAGQCFLSLAGTGSSYTPIWDATIEKTDVSSGDRLFKGAILIARSPISGAIHTYSLTGDRTIEISSELNQLQDCSAVPANYNNTVTQSLNKLLQDYSTNFSDTADVDFCINSPDILAAGNKRRNIRFLPDGHNVSAVELVDADLDAASGGNRCV